MKLLARPLLLLVAISFFSVVANAKKDPPKILGVACQNPAPLHCPDAACGREIILDPGNATEPKTGRKFFLDFPCDWKPGKKVTFILALHGAGSYDNWQRNYFPLIDYKDKYHL